MRKRAKKSAAVIAKALGEPSARVLMKRDLDAGSRPWQVFAEKYAGDERLAQPSVFALPLRLLKLLEAKFPRVFDQSCLKFERELRQSCGTGYVDGNAFYSSTLDAHFRGKDFGEEVVHTPEGEDSRIFAAFELDSEGMLRRRTTPDRVSLRISEIGVGPLSSTSQSRSWQRAYVAWLLTEPSFLRDREAVSKLTDACRDEDVTELFFRWRDHGVPTGFERLDQLSIALRPFLHKWCLKSLLAFELPQPLELGINSMNTVLPGVGEDLGLTLFVPWPFLNQKGLSLREIAQFSVSRTERPDLDEWLRGSKPGRLYLDRMLDLIIYRDIALEQRYAERLRGVAEELNEVFAEYWSVESDDTARVKKKPAKAVNVETVKQIGKELAKRRRRL